MQIQDSLKHIGDFAGRFALNALEGATLTSIVTFGPHVFQKYVHPGFTPLLDIPKAVAYTIMGAVGYSVYKTVLDPAASTLNKSITDTPKNITKFATDVIFPKTRNRTDEGTSDESKADKKRKVSEAAAGIYAARNDPTLRNKKIDDLSKSWFDFRKDPEKKKRASLYSTSVWSLGTLSVFGGLYSVTSKMFESPVAAFLVSAAGSLGGSYFLNRQAIYYGKKIAEGAKQSDLFKKTCEAVEKVWTFGGTTLKLAILGSGIWGAHELKETFVDPVVSSDIADSSIQGASALWRWTSYVAGNISGAVEAVTHRVSPLYDFIFNSESECVQDPEIYDQMYETIRNGHKNVSEIDLPPHTPEECRRIFENKDFINNYIKPTWDFSAKVASNVSSSIRFGFGLLGSGLYIASGLVFRESTLEECASTIDFKENNLFLCTNAERIDNIFTNYLNPAGNTVKNGTLYVLGGISSIFNKSWSVTMASTNIVSGLLFRESTLDKCANTEGFKEANGFLCKGAERIDSIFTDYLNPAGAAARDGASSLKDGLGSIFTKSWSAIAAGAGIVSGLIFRESTLDKCASTEGFKEANEFLCTNAGRINTAFTDYLNPLGSDIAAKALWLKDTAAFYGGAAVTTLTDAAKNPTVQKGALGIAATGVALYGLHALATKTQEYFAPKEVLPQYDIEQGMPVAEVVTEDADEIPPREMKTPSAPPMELMPTEEDDGVVPVDVTPSAPPIEQMPTSDVDPSLDLLPVNTEVQEKTPVTFLSKVGTMFGNFVNGVKVWMHNLYVSLAKVWENLWAKKPIDKN